MTRKKKKSRVRAKVERFPGWDAIRQSGNWQYSKREPTKPITTWPSS